MILDEWARRVLTAFAEAYPASAHYRGGRRLRLGGWEKRCPEIAARVDDKDAFLGAVDELSADGVIAVRWRRFRAGEEVDALYLDDPRRLFELLEREAPWDRRDALISALTAPPWDDPRLSQLAERTRARLETNHPLPVETARDLADIGRLLLVSPAETTGLAIRALSVHLFRDSKRLESLLRSADALLSEAEGETVSRRLGLARSYPEVSFALFGTLAWNNHAPNRCSWQLSGEIVTLPRRTAQELAAITPTAPSVSDPPAATPWILTVENKESFYATAAAMRAARREQNVPRGDQLEADAVAGRPPSAVIYAPGHPGPTVCEFVALAAESAAPVMHFGDLDPEGLLILQELAARTGHAVHPYLMNVETYRRYRSYGRDLSEHSVSRLREITHPDLVALAGEIGKFRVGVEQEVIPVSFA